MGYKARLTDCAARVTSQPRGWPIRKAPAKRYAVLSGSAARLVGLAAQLLAGAPRCRPRVGKVKYVCFADNRVDPIVRRNDRTQRRLGEGNRRRTGAGLGLGLIDRCHSAAVSLWHFGPSCGDRLRHCGAGGRVPGGCACRLPKPIGQGTAAAALADRIAIPTGYCLRHAPMERLHELSPERLCEDRRSRTRLCRCSTIWSF
jgi:hypothetical protein